MTTAVLPGAATAADRPGTAWGLPLAGHLASLLGPQCSTRGNVVVSPVVGDGLATGLPAGSVGVVVTELPFGRSFVSHVKKHNYVKGPEGLLDSLKAENSPTHTSCMSSTR